MKPKRSDQKINLRKNFKNIFVNQAIITYSLLYKENRQTPLINVEGKSFTALIIVHFAD